MAKKTKSEKSKKPSTKKAIDELKKAEKAQKLSDEELNSVVGGVCGWNQTKQMNQVE